MIYTPSLGSSRSMVQGLGTQGGNWELILRLHGLNYWRVGFTIIEAITTWAT